MHCIPCNITFRDKYTFNKHLKTTKHKLNVEGTRWYYCDCGKKYQYKKSRKLHQTNCMVFIANNEGKSQQETQESSELAALRSRVAELEEKLSKKETVYVTNINNNTNNTSNNTIININAFGNENLNYLTEKKILRCLTEVYKSIPALIQKIHFDPNHPENHNVKITNKKLPYASVMGSDQKWKIMKRDEVISQMVDNSYSTLDSAYQENRNKFSESKQSRIDNYKNKYESDDKKTIKNISEDVELLVINNSTK